ncbi:hypothetical protein CG007_02675 [Mesoplasma entomophilum]|uniref:LacI family DNA-binding transcriptional regulator n=1 Tax=Mesoplasma entomophilum TaxID=2149 RepID=UPI000D02BE0F|nr:LacI family DNA-binding transcriptional regulator [Mesoplasma entomophilum]AVN60504.1 hypothetical protein CG007_02675 [Mesoplasma entomophilum]
MNKERKITYHDISKMANVAIGTVSRYFNGEKISDKTRIKIDNVLKEINYVPNFAASTLRKKNSDIYVVTPSSENETINMPLINGIKFELNSRNINFFQFMSSPNPEIYEKDIKYINQRNPLGIISFMPKKVNTSLIKALKEIKSSEIITYNYKIEGVKHYSINFPEIFKNLAEKIDQKLPNNNIAFLGIKNADTLNQKMFQEVHNNFINGIKKSSVTFHYLEKNDFSLITQWMEKTAEYCPANIVVCETHVLSVSLYEFLYRNNLRDKFIISDIGKDDFSQKMVDADIKITIDYFKVGRQIVKSFFGEETTEEQFYKISFK